MQVETFEAIRVGLATSADILSWSAGEVKKPETINYRTLKPEKDGLFCERIFGPTKDWECSCGKYKRARYKDVVCERCGVQVAKSNVRRERMGHITLAAPVTHIWYYKGVPSRLGYLLDLAPKELDKIIYFAAYRVMARHEDEINKSAELVRDDYAGRIVAVLNQRAKELQDAASEEFQSLEEKGYKLQISPRIWEAPEWVPAEMFKGIDELISHEVKRAPEIKEALVRSSDARTLESFFDVKTLDAPSDKSIRDLQSAFKKKTDKIVREYGRKEHRGALQREQLAWHMYLALPANVLIQYDDIFDMFDYNYGEYFDLQIGAEAVKQMLQNFKLEEVRDQLRDLINNSKGTKQTYALKRLKVVSSFIESNTSPVAMVLDVLPVLPPEIRPMVQLDGGRFATSDLNDLYRRVINRNNRLLKFQELDTVPRTIINNEKRMLQEAVDALFDNGRRGRPVTGTGNRALKSLSDLLKGKQGRFRQNLLGKRVDYSGRSVIVVGPQLKLHQCGLPKLMALELFKPFVMKRLEEQGYAQNIKAAKKMVERSRAAVWEVLEEVIRERPVLLNRAPTLHRLGIQAFEPVLVEGKAIQLHPLVCTAFNADFDGDQMAVHVPLSQEAQAEARVLMLASNNILKPSDGRPVATPTQDMIIGLYHLTDAKKNPAYYDEKGKFGEVGRYIGPAFGSVEMAWEAYNSVLPELDEKGNPVKIKLDVLDLDGKAKWVTKPARDDKGNTIPALALNDIVKIRIDGAIRLTTLGRALFNETLPAGFRYVEQQVGKKEISQIVTELVERNSRVEVAQTLDRVKDAGFYWATRSGVSMSISDANFDSNHKFDDARALIIKAGEEEHRKKQDEFNNGLISEVERRDALGTLWNKRTIEIETLLKKSIPEDNAIFKMVTSGARGNWIQIRSIMGMRGPVATASGDFAPMPVKGNYLVGLTANEYFINATGARKGNADTAMKTAAAGYLTRRLVDVAQDVIVREPDCGTERGLEKEIKEYDADTDTFKWNKNVLELSVLHRFLAEPIMNGKDVLAKAGALVDQTLLTAIQAEDANKSSVDSVVIRSVLTCNALNGVCAACYGTSLATGDAVELGEAIGIIAAQSIGEPGTQLTMRTFHTGGASDKQKKQIIKKRIGGVEMRIERAISYDITQGLTGVTDLLEARIGWNRQGKVAVMAFWPGVVDVREVETKGTAKKYEIRVVPQGEKALADAKDLATRYSFSRTTSKTFKKLDPELPITTVSDLNDLVVEAGQAVETGDYLVDGTPIPHEVLSTKGRKEAAKEIINGVQAIYGAQGVELHDKHLEVIVRQMLGKVTVVDGGDTKMLPGEIIDRNAFAANNREVVAAGKKPASAREEVMGMTRASLAAQSWLSAASFQETTRVLTQAALDRRTDPLVGLKENVIIGKLIPAGTGLKEYRNIKVEATEEAKNEMYPNRIWAAPVQNDEMDLSSFGTTGLAFTSIEEFDQAGDEETAK
jgi:DNA-directed RNA polymerase subunit beta'